MPDQKSRKKRIPTPEEVRRLPDAQRMKYEIAEELGVMDKVRAEGWKSLTSRESGKIGGILRHRLKNNRSE